MGIRPDPDKSWPSWKWRESKAVPLMAWPFQRPWGTCPNMCHVLQSSKAESTAYNSISTAQVALVSGWNWFIRVELRNTSAHSTVVSHKICPPRISPLCFVLRLMLQQGEAHLRDTTVEYYFWFIKIVQLTSDEVIARTKIIFTQRGIPKTVILNKCFQYASEKFAQEYQLKHTTSSPYFPQSNRETERAKKDYLPPFRKALSGPSAISRHCSSTRHRTRWQTYNADPLLLTLHG